MRLPNGLGASRRQRPRLSGSGPRQNVPRAGGEAARWKSSGDDAVAARRIAGRTSAIDLPDVVATTDVRWGPWEPPRSPR